MSDPLNIRRPRRTLTPEQVKEQAEAVVAGVVVRGVHARVIRARAEAQGYIVHEANERCGAVPKYSYEPDTCPCGALYAYHGTPATLALHDEWAQAGYANEVRDRTLRQ